MLIESRGDGSALGFAGEYSDATGLIYLRARYMDPSTGTFLSRDPVWGVAGGGSIRFNPYIYAGANPTNYLDPSGRIFGAILGGALIGGALGAAFDVGGQLLANGGRWECINWNQTLNAAIQGAVLGALGGFAHGLAAAWGLSGAGTWAAGFMFEAAIGTAWDVSLNKMSMQDALVSNVVFALAFEGAFEGAGKLWGKAFGNAGDDVARAVDTPSGRSATVEDFNTGGRVGTASRSGPNAGNSVRSRRTWYADNNSNTPLLSEWTQSTRNAHEGLGDLSIAESFRIQSVVDSVGQDLYVVGSAATRKRRFTSDIDYLVTDPALMGIYGYSDAVTGAYLPHRDLPINPNAPANKTHGPIPETTGSYVNMPYIQYRPNQNPVWYVPRDFVTYEPRLQGLQSITDKIVIR